MASIYKQEQTDDEILQNQFTAYLVLALHHHKGRYCINMKKKSTLPLDNYIGSDLEPRIETDPLDTFSFEDTISDERLQRAFAGLKDRERLILLLRYVEDLSLTEIAHRLNSSYPAVKSACFRALRLLKEALR